MGEVYSHLSEEERRAIQIEIGDGTSVRKIARLLGRSPSGISREIKRNTWVPVRRERVLPAVPAETAEDGPVDGRMLHRRPRAARDRPQARQTAQAPPHTPPARTPPARAAGAPNRASATACHANARGRGWPNGRVAAGRRCRPARASASRTTTASSSPTTRACATSWAYTRASPTRTPAGSGEAMRTGTA